jgi:CBS domain-containing protein
LSQDDGKGGVMGRWSVADVMTEHPVSVNEDTPFKELVDVLEAHGVNAVPVVDADGRVLGLVSSADLIPKIEFAGSDGRVGWFKGRRYRTAKEKAHGTAAADVMTAPAVTVEPDVSLVAAARLMETGGLKRLPVVDELGRLVGMLTRSDLLKVFLRPDDDIRREVVDEVLANLVGVEPAQVRVRVDDGVVTLLGQLDRRSLVPMNVRAVEQVDGVVDVVSDLSYRVDDIEQDPRLHRMPTAG